VKKKDADLVRSVAPIEVHVNRAITVGFQNTKDQMGINTWYYFVDIGCFYTGSQKKSRSLLFL